MSVFSCVYYQLPFAHLQVFKPDRTNGFDVQSEVDAYAEEELNRPKQLTAKARLVNAYMVL